MLTEHKLILRRSKNLFNTFNFSAIEALHVDKHMINNWLHAVRNSVAPLSYGIYLLLSYIFAVMALLLTAVVGLIISSHMQTEMKFSSVMRIATVAATPSIIAITISAAMGISAPGIVYAGITLLYLIAGIKACELYEEEPIDLKSAIAPKLSDLFHLDEAA
jgi:ABC-type sugar transport system permease subunit